MIGKILFFVGGFITGTLFGTAVGRWIFNQIVEFIKMKLGEI